MGLECCTFSTFTAEEKICFLITTFRRSGFPMFYIETKGNLGRKLPNGEINYTEDNIIDVDELPSP